MEQWAFIAYCISNQSFRFLVMACLPSDSEDSNLSDSDDEYEPTRPTTSKIAVSVDSEESSTSGSEDEEPLSKIADKGKPKYKWNKVNSPGNNSALPPFILPDLEDEPEVGRPIHYFKLFFSNDLLSLITEQSNLYACQTNPNQPLNLTKSELEIFIGSIIYMSIYGLPRHRLYWSSSCRVPQVADYISRKRWEQIKRNLHFNDNENLPKDRNDINRDKLFKLRPFLNKLQQTFSNQIMTQMLCIDEQIVPYKGMSSLKQYNPKKPNKWGYKIFVLCDSNGLIHNFEVYTGKITSAPGKEDIGASGNIVLRLAAIIPQHKNYLLFFDNWFTSIKLLTSLYKDGIYSLGTIRKDRIPGLIFSTDKDMKKKGRGTYEEYETTIDQIRIFALKWFDNKSVCLASTFCGSQPTDIVQRFDRKSKTKIDIPRPNMIKQYNHFMGGVDLLDGLISYYRIGLRSRKWYMKIFFHFIDLVIVTAWIRYRTDMLETGLEKKHILDSLAFRAEVAEGLCLLEKGENTRKRGRPSGSVERDFQEKKKRSQTQPIPQFDVRTDKIAHFPIEKNERQRCKKPLCGLKTYFYCTKCNIYLCISKKRNCFVDFHM